MIAGRLHILNESVHDSAEVERLVRFALADLDIRGEKLVAVVRDSRKDGYRGFAAAIYYHTCPRATRDLALRHNAEYVIRMSVPPLQDGELYPSRAFSSCGVMLDYRTWQEVLVGVTAHEGRHIQDYYDGRYGERKRLGNGARRRVGDQRMEPQARAAERYALDRYRRSSPTSRRCTVDVPWATEDGEIIFLDCMDDSDIPF